MPTAATTSSHIPSIFAALRARNAKALMPFICGGHPRPGDTARILPALEKAGASIVEIGFPFSDPIADGPVIAAAMHEVLKLGVTPHTVLAEIKQARANGTKLGIVAMVSISIVHRFGAPRFIAESKAAGIDGFIFPDVPLEEAGDLVARSRDAGLTASLLVAPSTDPARAAKIAAACSGFVYLLARAGITGESGTGVAADQIAARVAMLRNVTDLPIACGFGIATAADVRAVVHQGSADAAIVGSALVRRLSDAALKSADPVAAAEQFTRELAAGLN